MAGCIWILDDDADLGSLLLEQFGQRGWQARHLQHPRELEQALDEAVPDLLVLDELLPGQRGTDVLLRLRQGHAQLPVLMLSALGAPATGLPDWRPGQMTTWANRSCLGSCSYGWSSCSGWGSRCRQRIRSGSWGSCA